MGPKTVYEHETLRKHGGITVGSRLTPEQPSEDQMCEKLLTLPKKMFRERLYLSPVDPDEVDTYLKWMNEDKALTVNFGQFPLMVSSKRDLNWLYEPPKNMHRYAIMLLDSDVLIESISLHNIDHLNRNAYIGIFIGDKEQRRKGYGAEAK